MQQTVGARAYDSSLRRENAQRTRTRILDAAAAVIGEEGDFVVAQVAERAGVSVRTFYHHFPDREAMLDALGEWLSTQLGYPRPVWPADLASFADETVTMSKRLSANAEKIRVFFSTPVGQAARRQARARRLEHLRHLAETELSDVDPQTARWLVVVIHELASSRTWLAMHEDAGFGQQEAAEAVAWAIKALLKSVKAGAPQEASKGDKK
jgi:AcrR family transcriptional regulator